MDRVTFQQACSEIPEFKQLYRDVLDYINQTPFPCLAEREQFWDSNVVPRALSALHSAPNERFQRADAVRDLGRAMLYIMFSPNEVGSW